ncbi:Dabb family protein [Citreimonas salinaria]|uniref:Stress responsive A/B Barrel Domain n=1 Tax=Citreimonas salinaria TaxID=321339 RepID=A0A1H3J9R5_9RHOB|nr:Dabb family protein [Citreimonas salinaria]SDY36652.1 Stress responsive A/B Barrel Domain [Citreimonas salinaria]
MIRHIVLVRFAPQIEATEIEAIWRDLRALKDRGPGIIAFAAGRNDSPEGMARGYDHGFVVDFPDGAARDAYLDHPDHVRAGARLVAATDGGVDGLLVFDLPISDEAP